MRIFLPYLLGLLVVLTSCQKKNIDDPEPTPVPPTEKDNPVPDLKYRTGDTRHLVSIDYEHEAYNLELNARSINIVRSLMGSMQQNETSDMSFDDYIEPFDTTSVECSPSKLLTTLLQLATAANFYSSGIHEYTFTYKTVNGKGEPTTCTSALIIPKKTLGITEVPMIVFPYYALLYRSLSPSYSIQKGFSYGIQQFADLQNSAVLLAELMARSGYSVLLPDGLGMGNNYDMHNMCTKVGAYSVIDAIMAARDITPNRTDAVWDKKNVYMLGISEGAYLALEASKVIQQEYDDVFNIKATACIDGPYDVSGTMMDAVMSDDAPSNPFIEMSTFIPSIVFSLSETYGQAEPFFLYTNAFRNDIKGIDFPNKVYDYYTDPKNDSVFINVGGYMKNIIGSDTYRNERSALSETYVNAMTDPTSSVRPYLEACNAFYNWMPKMPLNLLHNPADDFISVDNTINAYNAFIKAGSVTTEYTIFNEHMEVGFFHGGACIVGMLKGFKWFDKFQYGDRLINMTINLPDNLQIPSFQ